VTYSIVARDPETGALGVGVQTCFFAVGRIVPWAIAGVGAVATQAIAEPAYGPRCLERLQQGADAPTALAQSLQDDSGAALRQVAVVDASGRTAVHTGELCIDYAGDQVGEGYTVEANMMATPDVWPAMAAAFDAAAGSLGARIIAALHAGEAAGGDARGRMSAALLVVDGERHDHPWEGVQLNLRVDHHDRPLDELERLWRVATAFDAFNDGSDALFAGDPTGALRALDAGLALLPEDENLRFLNAGALLLAGRTDDGRTELHRLIGERPSWEVVVRSFATKGLLPLPPGLTVETLLER
jgi:uncharacterized Ntn-hydrolase superfamily protein